MNETARFFLTGFWPGADRPMMTRKRGVAKTKPGNKSGNKIKGKLIEVSIYAGFGASF
jgi:hypothetical protein